MMSTTPTLDPVKAKHRAMWAFGDYDAVSTEVIPALGEVIVEAAAIRAGDRVLDVAAGSGNASLPAARRGADVVASDLTPELLEIGRTRASFQSLDIQWDEADAEHLPYADASFDVAMSCVGVMFAPFHQPVADELVRVVRPGGRIALANWTPEGFIGAMFGVMKDYVPAPPAGASPGPLWGREEHVRSLLADRVSDLRAERRDLVVDRFVDAVEFREFFKQRYGPTIAAYRNLADDPARTAELDERLLQLGREAGADQGEMRWEYLLVTATRA
jgi:ubiquinone/menaquinone biosynthesis C-methylase UbiE